MPEFAEVEFFRKRWHLAADGSQIVGIKTHDQKKLLRSLDLVSFRQALVGAHFESSRAAAKQMVFNFSGNVWLGIHLGMSGELSIAPATHTPGPHDHLVLVTTRHSLVFKDPRMFGRIDFHVGQSSPPWWSRIAPAIRSPAFSVPAVTAFLKRRARTPIKATLLMQERFPGIGNWMADEILWRSAIHPARLSGSLTTHEVRTLHRECRQLCRMALAAIAGRGDRLPADLNIGIPNTWLFNHRWQRGQRCPLTGVVLAHATIGGRTTCWSPARQKLI
jgi:formamidopyrimidine-DNA glycosylase